MNWTLYLTDMAPYFAIGAVVIALVVVVDRHGHRLIRHDEGLRILGLRVDNLHRRRRRAHVRSLQLPGPPVSETRAVTPPPETPRPPPLSDAGTLEVDESWFLRDTVKTPPREDE